MTDLLSLTGPIFALIGLGWVAVRSGLYEGTHLPALGRFVILFCLPALLWRALGQRSPTEVVNADTGRLLLAYAVGSLVALGVGWWWARRRGQGVPAAAMTGLGMACSNSAFIGFPIALQTVGPDATVALALVMVVENFLVIPLSLALADSAAAGHLPLHRAIGRAVWGLRRNPIVLGILLGLATGAVRSATGHGLPPLLHRAVDLVAQASAAVSLFYVGGSLVGMALGRELRLQVAAVSLGKLVLHPLAVGAGVWLLHQAWPLPTPLRWTVVLMASAPMLSIYPILGQRHGLQQRHAACLLGATLASFFSLAAVAALLALALGAPR